MHKLCFDQIYLHPLPTNSPYSSSLVSPPNVLFSFFFKTQSPLSAACIEWARAALQSTGSKHLTGDVSGEN